ncbi:hypothetical protein C2845_PM06G32910 [Panicum miliaceum]|uniref:F-box/kelch-repeat protein n=1 Tax=Panicum miliaceum TaxID=4540 RepID=A0A3L6R7B4_PANMI|nr:hypothetical protein C2845_PM06G32910 [Panicum miliaceum]
MACFKPGRVMGQPSGGSLTGGQTFLGGRLLHVACLKETAMPEAAAAAVARVHCRAPAGELQARAQQRQLKRIGRAMSFRRLVQLVVDDVGLRRSYSLRSIDMSHLFRRPPRESTGDCGRPDQPPPPEEDHEMKPCPLPAPTMTFYPPRRLYYDGEMAFMLLGGRHNKVVAADQTGRAVLYDPDQHAVRTLRGFAALKSMPASLTVDEDHLYVLGTVPCGDGRYFECHEFDHDGDEDWHPRVLPPPPYMYGERRRGDPLRGVDSYATVSDGGLTRILVSKARIGTYSFDTAAEAWSKAGDWMLPFSGRAEDDGPCTFCAVDLAAATARRPPAVRNLWKDFAPPAEWMVFPPVSCLVHLGSARFCIARFFTTDLLGPYPVGHAVFTAVEVERCAAADGGLRMVKHGSLYMLLHEMQMIPWVL